MEGKKSDGDERPITDNWRPVQPLNERPVYRSFISKDEKDDDDDVNNDDDSKVTVL